MTERAREIESGDYEVRPGCDFYTAPRSTAPITVAAVTVPDSDEARETRDDESSRDDAVKDAADAVLSDTRSRGFRRR